MKKKDNSSRPGTSQIISRYMEYCEANYTKPENTAEFCLNCNIEEDHFEDLFSSLDDLESEIWNQLMIQSIDSLKNDIQYDVFKREDKLLALYFTFFENLGLNRNYLLLELPDNKAMISSYRRFKKMKKSFTHFVDELFESWAMAKVYQPLKPVDWMRRRGLREGFWGQLVFLISFWRSDDSKDFEKTDIAIEKSLRVAMDLLDTSTLNNIVDLGKFIWSEKIFQKKA